MSKIYKGREGLVALAEGKKLRKDFWPEDHFIYMYMDVLTYDQDGERLAFNTNAKYIEYQEPKKQKEITLYRYTYIYGQGQIEQSLWVCANPTHSSLPVIKTETKTILVDDLEGEGEDVNK